MDASGKPHFSSVPHAGAVLVMRPIENSLINPEARLAYSPLTWGISSLLQMLGCVGGDEWWLHNFL